jgi:hypothetical protein
MAYPWPADIKRIWREARCKGIEARSAGFLSGIACNGLISP